MSLLVNVGEVRDRVASELKEFLNNPPRVSRVRLDADRLVVAGGARIISTGIVSLRGSIGISEYIDGFLKEYYEDRVRGEWVHWDWDYKYSITMKILKGREVISWLRENASLNEDAIKWLGDNTDRLYGTWSKVIRLNYKTNEIAYYDEIIIERLLFKPSRWVRVACYLSSILTIANLLFILVSTPIIIYGKPSQILTISYIIGLVACIPLCLTSLILLGECKE